MWKRRKMRGMMIVSLYEDLPVEEQRLLERHLNASAEVRAECESLRKLIEAIPRTRPDLPCDLMPAVRARLAPRPRTGWVPAWGMLAAALCMVLSGALIHHVVSRSHASLEATGQQVAEGRISPGLYALREASALIAQKDYGNAYRALQAAMDSNSGDEYAGQVQEELAQLTFERLKRYREAYEAYILLKKDYPRVFVANHKNADNLDLLDESRRVNFASLELLDAAMGRRGDSLVGLEEVVSLYPTTQVAALAMDEMARRVLEGQQRDERASTWIEAMEEARDRCRNPLAVAQFNIRVANAYWRERHDVHSARDLAHRALDSDSSAVVELARNFLDDLNQAVPSQ